MAPLLNGAKSREIKPPAADETLIYVIREGKFAGSGAKLWVAMNDKTVARVKNKQYAVVRAKAGLINLNLATMGVILASTAIDDRPGETVYLTYRVGELEFTEIDKPAGEKFVRKAKETAPLKAPLDNAEETLALMRTHVDFDLMRPASQQLAPDDGHAVISIFRRKEIKLFDFGRGGVNRAFLDPYQTIRASRFGFRRVLIISFRDTMVKACLKPK